LPNDAPRLLVVGSVNTDLRVRVPSLPTPGATILGGALGWSLGGKGANQALTAAALDGDVMLVGAVGSDEFGATARDELDKAGVDVSGLRNSIRPTGVAQVFVDDSGENCIVVSPGANADLDPGFVASTVDAAVRPGDVLLASLEIPLPAVEAAVERAAARGARVVVNPAPAQQLPEELLQRCDVLAPNQHEVRELVPDAATEAVAAQRLLAGGVGAVVVTRGGDGARLYRPGRPVHEQAAIRTHVVDSVGAGDAFCAALAWSLRRGDDLPDAVLCGAAAGAISCSGSGPRGVVARARDVLAAARSGAVNLRSEVTGD
jgi:ribokinase